MMTKKPTTQKLPIGVSDFKEMTTGDYCYVDKSLFIREIMDKGDKILLIPRPRRFGKTLNLSMLKYFYDCCPVAQTGAPNTYKTLFDSLAISKADPKYLEKMGNHPVIFISFRDIKEPDWEITLRKIKKLIRKEYARHYYLLQDPKMMPHERDYFRNIIDLKGGHEDYESSLENLLIFLNRHYNQRAVILIDEYDAPIHAGFNRGYYDDIINFIRNFLCGGLKDTDQYLEKAVLTGILRVAKESIFSGLNNPGVYTLLSESFNDKFGFTEQEVEKLLHEFGVSDRYDDVRQWYNGYRFGGTTIYNPWSIINFLSDEAKKFRPHWTNTSDNSIVESLLSRGGKELKDELEQLIRDETIEKVVNDNIVLKNVFSDDNSLWSFLLQGGYLKTTGERTVPNTGKTYYQLAIPNLEVKTVYVDIIERYFSSRLENKKLEIMLKALLDGEIDVFEEIFSDYVTACMSFFDTAVEPEKVYHAFVMGLLLWIVPDYQVKSNRESGYGRYDIMIIPADPAKPGHVIEFKKVRPNETVESAIASALKQIEDRKYETELVERGIKNIKKLAVVFSGKQVFVRE